MKGNKGVNKKIFIILGVVFIVAIILLLSFSSKDIQVKIVDNQNGEVKTIMVSKNTKIEELAIPQKDGYEFLHFTLDGNVIDKNDKLSKDVTLTAIFQEKNVTKNYTVSFDDGENITNVSVVSSNKVEEPKVPEKKGYLFRYWELDGSIFDFNTSITKDICLKAIWQEYSSNTKLYQVTFDSNGGSKILARNVKENDVVIKPSSPVRSGYTFVEWQLNGNKYDFNTKVISNITLVAVWEKVRPVEKYTVQFNSNGGTNISNQSVESAKKAVQPNDPVKSGYTFVEWQLNGKKYDFDTKVTNNITLVAVWEKVKPVEKYTVQFDSNGGTNILNKIVESGNVVAKPNSPSKKGYTFVEWQLNGKKYDFNTKVTSNITLVAVWKNNKESLITSTGESNQIHVSLQEFLKSKGSSVVSFNTGIMNAVKDAGPGTRAGVVAAAKSLVSTLYLQYSGRLPYTYGGGHGVGIFDSHGNNIDHNTGTFYGVDPLWGSRIYNARGGTFTMYIGGNAVPYYYYGPDNSGFVGWALKNGGFDGRPATDQGSWGEKHAMDGTYIGQLGDLIWHTGHIMLIIDVDEDAKVYYIAHAAGGSDGIKINTVPFTWENNYIVDMTEWYRNHVTTTSPLEYERLFQSGKLA